MTKITLWHEPQYGHFFLQDLGADHSTISDKEFGLSLAEKRFFCAEGIIAIGVVSDFTEIPITVEYSQEELIPDTQLVWDLISEAEITLLQDELLFVDAVNRPKYGRFGELRTAPGKYRVRIHFGGQHGLRDDGHSKDFYLLQIWPHSRCPAQTPKRPNQNFETNNF